MWGGGGRYMSWLGVAIAVRTVVKSVRKCVDRCLQQQIHTSSCARLGTLIIHWL